MLTRAFDVARLTRPARLRRPCTRSLSHSVVLRRQVGHKERDDYEAALQIAEDNTERVLNHGEMANQERSDASAKVMQQSRLPSLFKIMTEAEDKAAAVNLEKPGESSASAINAAEVPMTPSRKGKERAVDAEPDQAAHNVSNNGQRRPPRLLDVVDSAKSVQASKRELRISGLKLTGSVDWTAEECCRRAASVWRLAQAGLPR